MSSKPKPKTGATIPKLMTFAEAAAQASNSSIWWRRLAARRGIGVVRLGRSVRILESDVERVVREGMRPARENGR